MATGVIRNAPVENRDKNPISCLRFVPMESLLVSFEIKEKYLLVVGHGKRDSFTSMVKSTARIYEKVIETNIRFLLLDYRHLEFNLQLNEAFNIVKRYEAIQRSEKLTMALVFKGRGLEFGKYLRDVASQRGFDIEIFEDINSAEKWLLKKIP
jgi:hypothetical protein